MARRAGSSGARTAQNLRRAALRLFARHGYAAVSMRMIAQEVGVQPGALYNHLENKQDLLRNLLTEHMTELLDAWEDPGGTPPERLEAFTRFHVRHHLDRGDEVFVSYMELRSLAPENYPGVAALRQRYESVVTDILSAGAEAGDFRIAEPRIAAKALIAMLTGVTAWFREDGRHSARRIEDIYTDMAARSVGLCRE